MTQTKYTPNGLIEVQEGTKIAVPATVPIVTNFYSLFGASGTNINKLTQTTNGPSSGVSYSGNFIAGLNFYVSQGNCYLFGFWIWVQAGTNPNPTGQARAALWQMANIGGNLYAAIAASFTVFAGPLVPGWNFVTCTQPVPLTPNANYIAAVAVNGNFNDTTSYFGTGPGNGLHNGPLYAVSIANPGWSDGGTPNISNGLFSVAGTDPRTNMPGEADGSGDGYSNFWVDVVIGQTTGVPSGYTGTYKIWPNWPAPAGVQTDSAEPYNIATEFTLTQKVTLENIWFYSVTGCTGLPTECAIWTVPGGQTAGTIVSGTDTKNPTWLTPTGGAGSAGAGWLKCVYGSVILNPGTYKVSVYDGEAVPTISTTKLLSYWESGNPGFGGWINGPLEVPDTAHGNEAWIFNSGDGGATPPFSSGVQEKGQNTFSQNPVAGSPITYPFLYVDGLFQNYLVDVEVS